MSSLNTRKLSEEIFTWKGIKHWVLNRIKQGIIGNSIWWRRQRQKEVTAGNNKIKGKELSSLQLFVVIASIIIILIALGGLGLVFNVFAQTT